MGLCGCLCWIVVVVVVVCLFVDQLFERFVGLSWAGLVCSWSVCCVGCWLFLCVCMCVRLRGHACEICEEVYHWGLGRKDSPDSYDKAGRGSPSQVNLSQARVAPRQADARYWRLSRRVTSKCGVDCRHSYLTYKGIHIIDSASNTLGLDG